MPLLRGDLLMRDQRGDVASGVSKAGRTWFLVRLAMLVGLAALYRVESDLLAPVRMYPYWCWAALVPLVSVPLRPKKSGRAFLAILVAFIGGTLLLSEEPYYLLASGRPQTEGGRSLRIISINCAGGSTNPVAEALAKDPDVLLLQESPSGAEIGMLLAGRQDLTWVTGPDGSVIVRGKVDYERFQTSINSTSVRATVKGREYMITSFRLRPPVFRLDYYSPEAWRAISRNLSERKAEFNALMLDLQASNPDKVAQIIGGDFNAPPTVTQSLRPGYDLALEGGSGWNGTATNEYPLVRIDRVYTSFRPSAVRTTALKTESSDHRMVVSDIVP